MENYKNNNPKARNYCVNHFICNILPKNHINPVIFLIIINHHFFFTTGKPGAKKNL